MTTLITEVLPAAICEQLRRFLEEGRSGTIHLDVRAGKIIQARAEAIWPAKEILDKEP